MSDKEMQAEIGALDQPFLHHKSDDDSEKVTWSNCLPHYYRGLSSSDPKLQRRSRWIIYGNCIGCTLLVVVVILTFTVIIPAVIQSIVNQSDLQLITVSITNPGNVSFASSVVQKFTSAGSISAKAKMNDLTISWEGNDIVTLTDESTITVTNNKENTMDATAVVINQDEMIAFEKYLIAEPSAEWNIDGTADVTFLVTAKVNFHKTISLQGYNNFSVKPQILNTNVTEGLTTTLYIAANVILYSESNVEMALGQSLKFQMEVNGVIIGIGELPNFVMTPGSIATTASMALSYTNQAEYDAINSLIGQFASGYNVNATLKNFFLPTPVSWLSPALNTIRMYSVLPGCDTPLVQQINLYMKKIPENLPFTLQLYNPQPVALGMQAMNSRLYYLGVEIATVHAKDLNITVPPHSVIITKQIPSQTVNTPQAAAAFNKFLAAGQGPVDLAGQIVGNFGNFVLNITYVQYNVTMVIVN